MVIKTESNRDTGSLHPYTPVDDLRLLTWSFGLVLVFCLQLCAELSGSWETKEAGGIFTSVAYLFCGDWRASLPRTGISMNREELADQKNNHLHRLKMGMLAWP